MHSCGGQVLLARDFDEGLADVLDGRGKVTARLFGAD